MTKRPRHQDKDIEKTLKAAEEHGWTFTRKTTYFKGLCGCGIHKKWIHLTPSSGNYNKNLRKWLERSCW